jgi:phage-related protein
MDQKLLDALNNLSIGLEKISEALKDKSSASPVSTALGSVDIDEKLKMISDGIQKLREDNKKILDNQKTLIGMSKSNKTSEFEQAGTPKQMENIKKGVSSILLIAVGVLAIGSAFKLLGDVDFGTVIAISIALPLLAVAFEKIGQSKVTPGQAGMIMLVLISMSVAIWLSSKILSQVQPIGLFQLTTSIMIAGMFAVISYNLDKLMEGLSSMSLKSILMIPLLPIVLIGVSLAIVGSSRILKGVQPVGLFQMITSIMIAGMFAVVSYGLGKILSAFKDLDMADAIVISAMLPLVLIGVSYSIMKSSQYLSKVTDIKFSQFLTSVGISLILIPISFALPFISKAMEKINIGKIILLPIILTAMAVSIYYSSLWLSKVQTIELASLVKITLLSLSLAIMGIALGVAFRVLGGLDVGKTVKAGINLVIISMAVWLSSFFLNKGEYGNYPSLGWAVGFSITALLLTVPVAVLGMLGLPIVAMGAVGLVLIAGAIWVSSFILSGIDTKFFYKMADAVAYLVKVMAEAISYGLKVIAPALKLFIETVGDSIVKFAKNILPPIVSAMGELTQKVMKPLLELLVNSLPEIGKFLDTVVKSVFPVIKTIIDGVKSMFESISQIFSSIVSGIGAIGNTISGIINSIGTNVTKVIDSIGNVFKKIGGVFDSVANVINSVVGGIERIAKVGFMDLAKAGGNILDFMDTVIKATSRFKELGATANPLISVANAYDKLASSLRKISSELNTLDTEKLLALKNMTGSIVMLSLMDPTQYEKMMAAFEEKAPLFRDVMNDMNGSRTEITPIKTTTPEKSTKSMDDLYNIMEQVAVSTRMIATDSSKLSRYVDEIRGGDVINLSGKK